MENNEIVENLMSDYDDLIEKNSKISQQVRSEYRGIIQEEIARRKREHELAFALKLEHARRLGVKRKDLELPVFKTKDGIKYKYYVELAGGSLNTYSTAEERIERSRVEERQERENLLARLGWTERHDGLFMDSNGLVFEIKRLEDQRVYPFPVDETRWDEAHKIGRENAEELKTLCKAGQ